MAAAPRTGAVQTGLSGRSLAHAAEELIRSSGDARMRWQGMGVGTLFQPIYCLKRRFSLGFEAFAAVGEGEPGAASLFAGTDEDERALLDWSCRALHLRNYATVDPGDRMLFLNVHPDSVLRDAHRAREFGDLIRYYGLHPKRVCIEIVGASCSDAAALREAALAYRGLGLSIALDDFTGDEHDFERFASLRPDVVKVDCAAVAPMRKRAQVAQALAPLVERLRSSQARVAIEGIEHQDQALGAIDARADYLQGFHFATPLEHLAHDVKGAAILDHLLQARRTPAAA
jgi:EAL domain-containing protein (putative c-di-GMP-specific phosphodiesterase class I)